MDFIMGKTDAVGEASQMSCLTGNEQTSNLPKLT